MTIEDSMGQSTSLYKTPTTRRARNHIFQQGVKVKNDLFDISEVSIF